jgi:hypothetical protein
MAKHIRIVGETMDELDSGEDGITFVWKKLEDSAMLAANDHTAIHKRDGRRGIVTTNRCRPK